MLKYKKDLNHVTELNTKNKTVKVDWYIPIEFCHTKGTIAHGGTVSFILDASMFLWSI